MYHSLSLLACLLLGVACVAEAMPQRGSCQGVVFPLQSDRKTIDSLFTLRVLRHNAEVYQTPHSSTVHVRLPFSEPLEPVRLDEGERGRLQIKKIGEKEPMGWINREDLLCGKRPLLTDQGIERKVFIWTPPVLQGAVQNVTAYPMSQGQGCANRCRQLGRFEMYFILADDPESKRYLLADRSHLDDSTALIGWVEDDKVLPWNTVLGLRPSEQAGQQIRIVPRLEDIATQRDTVALLEDGKEWYKYPMRIPILDIVDHQGKKYFYVAAPGIRIRRVPTQEQWVLLEKLRHIDVFILLDGSYGMRPYNKAIPEAVHKIVTMLSHTDSHPGSHFRFGLRSYRDDDAGHQSIDEGVSLPAECILSQEAIKANRESVSSTIQKSETLRLNDKSTKSPTKSLFRGLQQAVTDMASCPGHIKLLFVIGDAGDHDALVPSELIQQLKTSFPKAVMPFFIQAVHDESRPQNPRTSRFREQALKILDQVLPPTVLGHDVSRREHVLEVRREGELADKIFQRVKTSSVGMLITGLQTVLMENDDVRTFIQTHMAKGDLPVVHLELIREACETLGTPCGEETDSRIIYGYTPVSEAWVRELWLSSMDLDKWLVFLKQLIEFMDSMGARLSENKSLFATLLGKQVQQLVGGPPVKEAGETLAQYLQRRGGIPIASRSPLLQYELHEIRAMESCELRRLAVWLRSMRDILILIRADGTQRPVFEKGGYSEDQCPGVSVKGRGIPRITLHGPAKLGKDDSYRYDHAFRNNILYWLPEEFLP